MNIEVFSTNFSPEQEFDKGFRFTCYKDGDTVYKVFFGFSQKNEALRVRQNIFNNYVTNLHHLGDYVIPTLFGISEDEKGFSVILQQPYVSGVPLKRAFELAAENHLDKSKLLDFLGKIFSMYQNTGLIPDVFGRPHVFGWYNVLTTPNVRVETTNDALTPRLLDVGFTRISQNLLTRGMHNRLLANNIRKITRENA